eukprot:751947-Hanusia_phi.AAC.1
MALDMLPSRPTSPPLDFSPASFESWPVVANALATTANALPLRYPEADPPRPPRPRSRPPRPSSPSPPPPPPPRSPLGAGA